MPTNREDLRMLELPYKLDARHFMLNLQSDEDRRLAKVVSIVSERLREAQRAQLGKRQTLLGGEHDVVDSMYWDEFLLAPLPAIQCAAEAGVTTSVLLDFIRTKCMPLSGTTLFWMEAWFRDYFEATSSLKTELAGALAAMQADFKTKEIVAAKQKAKAAAEARHGRPGGSRDKQAAIRTAWASGIYGDRDLCATEEYQALGFGAWGTARRALRNTPDPSPWPGKKPPKTASQR